MRAIQQIKALRNDGISYIEISRKTGIPPSTIKTWIANPPNYFNYIGKLERYFIEFYSDKEKGDL